MMGEEALERGRGQERHVGVEEHELAGVAGHRALGHRQCVPGAALLALLGEAQLGARAEPGQRLADGVALVPDHHHHPPGAGGPGQEDRVGGEGPAAQPMEHLGLPRAHSLALAGGQDHGPRLGHVESSPKLCARLPACTGPP
jgi:hypothetical protein